AGDDVVLARSVDLRRHRPGAAQHHRRTGARAAEGAGARQVDSVPRTQGRNPERSGLTLAGVRLAERAPLVGTHDELELATRLRGGLGRHGDDAVEPVAEAAWDR